jgi:hypothetical protein
MKKALALLVVGVLATSANASIVFMEFDGGATTIEAAPSDMITVHIFLDVFDAGVLPAEEVGAFQATFLEEQRLWQMSDTVLPEGWEADSSAPGPLDALTQQINWARSPTGSIVGPGIHEIGTVTLHVADDAVFDDVDPSRWPSGPTSASRGIPRVPSSRTTRVWPLRGSPATTTSAPVATPAR